MKCLSIVKRLAVAAVAAAALIGPVTSAHALTFTTGEAVLAVFGNGTEYYKNLGSFSTLLTTGVDLDLSGILGLNSPTGVAGANPITYALFGSNSSASIFFGDAFAVSSFSTAQKNAVSSSTLHNGLLNWSGQLGVVPNPAQTLYLKTDALSFFNNINAAEDGTLGNAIPAARPAQAGLDSILHLLTKVGTTMSTVGTATLSSQTGHFVINTSAVPVPAAVVLFGTGLIGLVGVARRRVFGQQ